MNLNYETIKAILRIHLTLTGAKCRVDGPPLPPGPKIIAANHTYVTDIFHIPFAIPEQLHVLMQGSLFANPFAAWMLEQAGQVEVHREQRNAAFEKALGLLERGETVVIFPEGRLTPPGIRYPARTGAVRLAHASGAPIIPLGTYVSPQHVREVRLVLRARVRSGLFQLGGTCRLLFGEAWHPVGKDARALTDELMERIYLLVNQPAKESSCASPTSPSPIHPWSAARPLSRNNSPNP